MLLMNLSLDMWFAYSGAFDYMTDCRKWFSTFKSILEGSHAIQIVDDIHIWVTRKEILKYYSTSMDRKSRVFSKTFYMFLI